MVTSVSEHDTQPPSTSRPVGVRFDRWAVSDVCRRPGLHMGALERWLLMALCLLADQRTGTYTGTLYDLHFYTGMGRNQIPKSVGRLEDADLIAVSAPFGASRNGAIRILVWDQLIVGAQGTGWARIRSKALKRQPTCVICESTDRLHVHHRTYDRVGHEAQSDLVVLCADHHMELHAFQRTQDLSIEDATTEWLGSHAMR